MKKFLATAAAYCVALQHRLFLLAAVGLTVLFIGIATVRSTVDHKRLV